MRRSAFALCLFSMLLLGCQQEIDPSIISTPGTGGGTSGGGTTSTTTYQPLTTSSWWKFKDSASGAFSTMTATTVNKTFNGIAYKALNSVTAAQNDTIYMAAPQPNYYYFLKGNSPNTGAPFDLLFHYLNDTASVGRSWDYTGGQGNGFAARMKTTIMARNITVTVAGNTYQNVIHSQLEISYDMLGIVLPAGHYDFYSAKGVGLVRIRASLGFAGAAMETCSDLVDHHIQ